MESRTTRRTFSAIAIQLLLICCGNRAKSDMLLASYGKAKGSYLSGDLQCAEETCKEILHESRGFHQALLLLSKALFFQERYHEAEIEAKRLLRMKNDYREADLILVRVFLNTDRITEAGEKLDYLLSVDPSDPRLLYLRSVAAFEEDDLSLAMACLKEAGLFSDEYAQVFLDLGRLYYIHGLEGPALKELGKALSLLSEESLLRKPVRELMARIAETPAAASFMGGGE